METIKQAFVLLFLCVINVVAIAQLQPVYVFPQDDTILKKNYYEKTVEQKNAAINSLPKENKNDYKEIFENRFKEIEGLLKSSRSLTATEVHNYLQSVLQKIIIANPELKGAELRVIFSRDWWPNAYSMGEGTIAVNAGLFIFLDNEAELIFILCHELSHYYLDHSGKAIKKYVETVNSDGLQKELKRLAKEEFRVNEQLGKLTQSLLFDSRKHSRNNEAEADRQAFRFMKNTGYDCNAIISTLQLLDKVDDSSLFKPLNIEQTLNFNEYPFRKKWIQKESAIFSQLGADDLPLSVKEKDSLKTHPDCTHRIALLEDSIKTTGNTGQLFQVDESLFRRLKKDFIAEIMEQCYDGNSLSRNLYYSLLLLQTGENVPLAVFSVARCFNKLYEKQQQHKLGLTIDIENKRFSEDYNQLLRMLNKIRLDEIASINYYFCQQHQELMKNYAGFAEEMSKAARLKN